MLDLKLRSVVCAGSLALVSIPVTLEGRMRPLVETYAPDCAVTNLVTEDEFARRSRERPSFAFRDISIWDVRKDGAFASAMKLSGPFPFDSVLGSCHTFQKIIPPEKYFDRHPEYFAEVRGKRLRVQSQPCLSNPDVIRIATRFVLDRVRKNPAVRYFGVSQNDWDGHCTCEKCRALDEAEGSPAASILVFVNKIAAEVEKIRPDAVIATLAYQYSIKPPKTVRPRHNVMPCFCTIECDFSRPMTESGWRVNKATALYLPQWCRMSKEVFVWDYATNFRHYAVPFANLRALAANLRFYRDCGVSNIFEQSCRQSPHSDLAELKTYVAAKLMWNADLDVDVLVRDFCKAYYGAAAGHVEAYLAHLESLERDTARKPMQINESVVSTVYTDAFFERAAKFWEDALVAVRGDAIREERVRWGLFGVDAARVLRFLRSPAGGSVYLTDDPSLVRSPEYARMRKIARSVQSRMQLKPPVWLSERGDVSCFFRRQINTFAIFDPPAPGKADWIVPEWCIETGSALPVRRVTDPEAIGSHAIRSENIYSGRTAVFDMANALVSPGTEYRLLARVKVAGGSSPTGEVFRCGIYQGSPVWKEIHSVSFDRSRIREGGYAWYPFGTFVPGKNQKVFFAPGKDSAAFRHVTLNAFRLVPCKSSGIGYDGPDWPRVTPQFKPDAETTVSSGASVAAKKPDFSKPPEVSVVTRGGTSRLHIGGRAFPVFLGRINTAVRKDHLPRLADIPFNVVTVDNMYSPALFPKTGRIDPQVLMKRAALFATNCPNAYFIWSIDAAVPKDWAKANPGEICRDSEGEPTKDGLMPNWSSGSEAAAEIASRNVRMVIDAVESSPYANRVIGYLVTAGHTTEWLGWAAPAGRAIDFSPAALKSFRKFASGRYGSALADAAFPDILSRREPDGRLLWNPRDHLPAVACNEWFSSQMARNLVKICGEAKRHLGGRKLVGTYYGYTMTLFVDGCSQWRAHYALKDVLDSGSVDFLLSPQDYVSRMLGEPCIDMKPFSSIAARGVLPIIENDARTHNGRMIGVYPRSECQTFTPSHSRAVFRRDIGTAICRNQPLCLYDLMLGTAFHFPECGEDGATLGAVNRWCVEKDVRRTAGIAVVVGETSITASPRLTGAIRGGVTVPMYAKDGSGTVMKAGRRLYASELSSLDLSRIARIGSPVDYILAEDLASAPAGYKMYVFLNCTRFDGEFLSAVRRIRSRPSVILWTYAPGYVKGIDADVANMRELTGFDLAEKKGLSEPFAVFDDGSAMGNPGDKAAPLFEVRCPSRPLARYQDGSVAVAVKRTGGSTSVYSGVWLYSTEFLRRMADLAGVHSFVGTDDPVEANGSFFVLHARREGKKTVKLPRKTSVVDVFARRVVARDAETFEFSAPLHSSHMFYYGDDPDGMLRELARSCGGIKRPR